MAAPTGSTGQTGPTAGSEEPSTFTIALTGHRPTKLAGYDMGHPFYAELGHWLLGVIEGALLHYPRLELRSGMALGADTVWAQQIVVARQRHPDRVRFVADVPVMTQADRWPEPSRRLWRQLVDTADEVVVYAQRYHVSCLHRRNEGMIAAADLVLAVWDGSSGGTGNGVASARKMGKGVFVMTPQRVRERAGL